MRRESFFLWKVVIGGAAVIIAAGIVFLNIENIIAWMSLNDPFQGQWAVVQLTDGEILYGHFDGVSGSTIGLTDVYLLDKIAPEAAASAPQTAATSTGLAVTGDVAPVPSAQPMLVPVSDTPQLFINRTAVAYFKFVAANDPALPYLH